MEDIIVDNTASLERQLAQAEELLNVIDALRPDLPPVELHEFALQSLCGVAGYLTGSLWLYHEGCYQSAAWQGLDRRRAALMRGATVAPADLQRLLDQCQMHAGMQWSAWPLSATVPAPLQPPASAGHTLIVPLAYTDQVGFAALESAAPAPDEDILPAMARFADRIAVALDTARIVRAHLDTIAQLQILTEEQRQLQETVLALSAPLLPLLPGVLVLPLIGMIDTLRAERILEAELTAIIREQAQVVLVDITGTPVVDTNVAMQLIRSAEAARLLGCRTILVGVQPEIAQTLVGLGVNLRGITTRATLADGLQEALRAIGQRLAPATPR